MRRRRCTSAIGASWAFALSLEIASAAQSLYQQRLHAKDAATPHRSPATERDALRQVMQRNLQAEQASTSNVSLLSQSPPGKESKDSIITNSKSEKFSQSTLVKLNHAAAQVPRVVAATTHALPSQKRVTVVRDLRRHGTDKLSLVADGVIGVAKSSAKRRALTRKARLGKVRLHRHSREQHSPTVGKALVRKERRDSSAVVMETNSDGVAQPFAHHEAALSTASIEVSPSGGVEMVPQIFGHAPQVKASFTDASHAPGTRDVFNIYDLKLNQQPLPMTTLQPAAVQVPTQPAPALNPVTAPVPAVVQPATNDSSADSPILSVLTWLLAITLGVSIIVALWVGWRVLHTRKDRERRSSLTNEDDGERSKGMGSYKERRERQSVRAERQSMRQNRSHSMSSDKMHRNGSHDNLASQDNGSHKTRTSGTNPAQLGSGSTPSAREKRKMFRSNGGTSSSHLGDSGTDASRDSIAADTRASRQTRKHKGGDTADGSQTEDSKKQQRPTQRAIDSACSRILQLRSEPKTGVALKSSQDSEVPEETGGDALSLGKPLKDGFMWKLADKVDDHDQSRKNFQNWKRKRFLLQRRDGKVALLYFSEKNNGMLLLGAVLYDDAVEETASIDELPNITMAPLDPAASAQLKDELQQYHTQFASTLEREELDYRAAIPETMYLLSVKWTDHAEQAQQLVLGLCTSEERTHWADAVRENIGVDLEV